MPFFSFSKGFYCWRLQYFHIYDKIIIDPNEKRRNCILPKLFHSTDQWVVSKLCRHFWSVTDFGFLWLFRGIICLFMASFTLIIQCLGHLRVFKKSPKIKFSASSGSSHYVSVWCNIELNRHFPCLCKRTHCRF